jgi:hypothetical protein
MHQAPSTAPQPKRHRPKALTVFLAAFVAGAAAAVGINQALDVHLSQKKPQVESEPIFVALRSLPQGSPVTIWDVALRDWPKAMLPTTALRAEDSFEGCVLRHPLREGQPLLSVQLMRSGQTAQTDPLPTDTTFAPPTPATPVARAVEADLWTPAPANAEPAPATTSEPQRPVAAAQPAVVAPLQPTSSDVDPPATVAVAAPPSSAAVGPAAEPVPVVAIPAVVEPVPVATEQIVEPAEQAVDAGDAESLPVAVIGEPTLADPVPGEPTPADTPPPEGVGIESVVTAKSVTTPVVAATPAGVEPALTDPVADDAPALTAPTASAPRKSRDGITRYLVVPERIALQADAGFAEPPAAAQQPPAVQRPDVESLPPVRQNATAQTRPKPTGQQRSAQQARPAVQPQPAPQTRPQQQVQPPRRQAAPPSTRQATPAAPRGLGAMFPKLAAGFDAMTGGARQPRETDERYDEAVATDDPRYLP